MLLGDKPPADGGPRPCVPAVVLERPEPTEEAAQHLCLDKGYDNRPTRELVEGRSYVPHIRRIGEEKLDEAGDKRYPARR